MSVAHRQLALGLQQPAVPFVAHTPPAALAIARGTARLLGALGLATICELPLASGRRADLVGLGPDAEIWIVEIKSSTADFRADSKWPDYRRHCDRLFFATGTDVPQEIFPVSAGLIIADRFGATLVREAPMHRITAAARRGVLVRFARAAALRLQVRGDPDCRSG